MDDHEWNIILHQYVQHDFRLFQNKQIRMVVANTKRGRSEQLKKNKLNWKLAH